MKPSAILSGAVALLLAASISAGAEPADLAELIRGLPASLDHLSVRGPDAVTALRREIAHAPAERKAVLQVALAATLNQEGDPKGAREALKAVPGDAQAAVAARAAFENALAGEQLAEKNVFELYEAAAAGKSDEVAGRALMRLAVLHKFAGRPAEARQALERVGKLAGGKAVSADAIRDLDRFAETARNVPAAAIIAGPWRLRLMDTFAAPELTFPTYGRFFNDGWMQIYSEADRPNRFPLGLYSGGGTVQSEHLIAEFAVRLRKVVHPAGRWTAGFAVRTGPGGRGVTVTYSAGRLLHVQGPSDDRAVEPAVFRPGGSNTFRIVAADRRVELYLNGLPLDVVHDAPGAAGAVELLALGCVSDYDWYKVLVPADPAAPAPDNARLWTLHSAALEDAAAGRSAQASEKLTELCGSLGPDCESWVYLFRLIREHGTEKHLKMMADLWPDKVAPAQLTAAEQARLGVMMRWADPTVRAAFAGSAKQFNERRYDDAIKLLDGILEKAPGNLAALDARAEAYRLTERFDKSAEDCEAALKADSRSLMPLLRLATLARQQNNLPAEIKALERLVKTFPKFPDGNRLLDDAKRRANPRRPGGVLLT